MTVVLVPNAAIPPAAGAREAASIVLDRIDQLDPARPLGTRRVGQ